MSTLYPIERISPYFYPTTLAKSAIARIKNPTTLEKNSKLTIDATDRNLLKLLQVNGKLKIKELAEELGMTTTPVFERIKRLEREGYITGYTARVDQKKLGYSLVVLCTVSLQAHRVNSIMEFEEQIQQLPEVVECYHTTGQSDYLLKVVVKDMAAYQHFISRKLAALNNIGKVQSSFVMNIVKQSAHLPDLP